MSRAIIGLCAWLACGSGLASAQTPPPVVVVAQGDTIVWMVNALGTGKTPHKVKFGSDGATPIKAAMDIFDKLDVDQDGNSKEGTAGSVLLTARVKDNATPNVTFLFTCGVHPAQMLSLPIRVEARPEKQAARTHMIVAGPALHWHLHTDTTPK